MSNLTEMIDEKLTRLQEEKLQLEKQLKVIQIKMDLLQKCKNEKLEVERLQSPPPIKEGPFDFKNYTLKKSAKAVLEYFNKEMSLLEMAEYIVKWGYEDSLEGIRNKLYTILGNNIDFTRVRLGKYKLKEKKCQKKK
jgi:hypothetical protein